MAATKDKYLKAYNDAFGTTYKSDGAGNVTDGNGNAVADLDYSHNAGYAGLTDAQKNNLQNWYDAYLADEAVAKSATEQKLQAAKTNDLYLKYLGLNNKAAGLDGQGIADASLLRLQNNYLSALGGISSDAASRMSANYQNAMTAQRANEEGAAAKAENDIASAVASAYQSGMTRAEAGARLKEVYGGSSLVDKYLAQYGNWAEESADYTGDTPVSGKTNWYDAFDDTYVNNVVATSADVRGTGDYVRGQGVTDSSGHRWRIEEILNGDGKVRGRFITSGASTTDGNITKGNDGFYYMAIGGTGWLKLSPIA